MEKKKGKKPKEARRKIGEEERRRKAEKEREEEEEKENEKYLDGGTYEERNRDGRNGYWLSYL